LPIPIALWKSSVKECLQRLADEDYQGKAWFNKHAEQTSPAEQICQLLDDYQFEDFITSTEIGLSKIQKDTAQSLVIALCNFGESRWHRFWDPHLNPQKVFKNRRWKAIRLKSQATLRALFPDAEPGVGNIKT